MMAFFTVAGSFYSGACHQLLTLRVGGDSQKSRFVDGCCSVGSSWHYSSVSAGCGWRAKKRAACRLVDSGVSTVMVFIDEGISRR